MEIIDSDMLVKVGLFVVVQVLVYFILSNSSNVFSKLPRSYSFKPARSVSMRRLLAVLGDLPAGGEPSPTSADLRSSKSLKRLNSRLQD
nr:uncharacterized protein LOC107843169 [Ipomoea trifida]